jgi:DUF971 family protein
MSSEESAEQPVTIDLDRRRELRIRWADGRECVYPLSLLRRECPCAACRESRNDPRPSPLRIVPAAPEQEDMVVARTAELVGNYALRIIWKDGHDTGIYDFRLLRALCPPSDSSLSDRGPARTANS